jgi:hypothetical protein
MMATTTVSPFALYVSSVEGKLVTRYGTATRRQPSYIGARRDARDPTRITWETELVVALTTAEVARYRREYDRELAARALRCRTEQDYRAQLAREEQALAPQSSTAPLTIAAAPTAAPGPDAASPPAHVDAAPAASPAAPEAPHVEPAPHAEPAAVAPPHVELAPAAPHLAPSL